MKSSSQNSVPNSGLLVAAALPVELRLLINHFSATRLEQAGPWPMYCNADQSVVLVETGVGTLSAAGAVAHAMGSLSIPPAWSVLNLGIAGSGALPVGQWALGQEVVDTTRDTRFYLRPPRVKGMDHACVRSYAAPTAHYNLPALLDMEAAGIIATAKRFVALEQITVAKLVSDNSVAQQAALNKQVVLTLFEKHFTKLIPVLDYCLQYSEKQRQAQWLEPMPQEWLQRIHFSVSHKRRLSRLWRSYRVFFPKESRVEFDEFRSAREVIDFLEEKLQSVNLHWEET